MTSGGFHGLHFECPTLCHQCALKAQSVEVVFSCFWIELPFIMADAKRWVCCEAHSIRYLGSFVTLIRSKGCLISQTSESWELSVCEFLQLWYRAYSGGWVYFCQCSYKMGYTWFFELLLVFCCILQVFLLFKCCQDFQCSCRRKSKRMSGEVLKLQAF